MAVDGRQRASDRSCASDEMLAERAKQGDQRAVELLIARYRPYILRCARRFFLPGSEREDMIQEGMIGLFGAARSYRADRQPAFAPFARLCVTRRIISALKTATRSKYLPLNSALSLNEPAFFGEADGRTLLEVVGDALAGNPEEVVVRRQEDVSLRTWIRSALTSMERRVLAGYLDGQSYGQIARGLGRSTKAVDNALQRAKRKLRRAYAHPDQTVGAR
jgi:RNA polymerase sporulation-specific sigma factor